jgi:hypothetical protein
MAQANLAVPAEPGGGDYVEHGLSPRVADLVRRSSPSGYPRAAAASAATPDAHETAVAEAADCQPQNQSTGSGLSSEPAMLEAKVVVLDEYRLYVKVFRQRHR